MLQKYIYYILLSLILSFITNVQAKTPSSKVSLVYVVSARTATVAATKHSAVHRLTLYHPQIHYFTDRPVRKSGRIKIKQFVAN